MLQRRGLTVSQLYSNQNLPVEGVFLMVRAYLGGY